MKYYPSTRTKYFIRKIKKCAGSPRGSCPIFIIEGEGSPAMQGSPGFWSPPSGKNLKKYPAYQNMYKKHMNYHKSTRKVEVGVQWLMENRIPLLDDLGIWKVEKPKLTRLQRIEMEFSDNTNS